MFLLYSISVSYITHKTPKLKAPHFISKIQQSFCSFSVASYTLRRRFKIRDNGGTEQQNMLIHNIMNRVGIVVDMSHSAEKSTLDAIQISSKPIAITKEYNSWPI